MKAKFIIIIIAGLLLFFNLGISQTNAQTISNGKETSVTTTISNEDLQKIRENLSSQGIDNNTVNKLIKKVKERKTIDADVMTTEQAISSEEKVEGNTKTITYTYPDGSRSVLTVEETDAQPPATGTISIESIYGGSCTSGSGYSVCKNRTVSLQLSTYGYSFQASYQIVSGAYDSITWAGNWNVWAAGGTVNSQNLRIIKSTENANGPAQARLSAIIEIYSGANSFTRSLSLLVGSNSAWDRWNSYY